MNAFQFTALSGLALTATFQLIGFVRATSRRRQYVARLLACVAAAVAIAFPALTSSLARAIGIGRGTDLVLYLFIFASSAAMFHLYAKTVTLERKLTHLVRQDALRNAQPGTTPSIDSAKTQQASIERELEPAETSS